MSFLTASIWANRYLDDAWCTKAASRTLYVGKRWRLELMSNKQNRTLDLVITTDHSRRLIATYTPGKWNIIHSLWYSKVLYRLPNSEEINRSITTQIKSL